MDSSPTAPFQVRIAVRGYEVDAQGHLNQAVYLQRRRLIPDTAAHLRALATAPELLAPPSPE